MNNETKVRSYDRSEQWLRRSGQALAGGVSSSLRAAMKPVPLFVESASGSRVRDVDGNSYIDYLLAYGPLILGHAHPALSEALERAARTGIAYGLQHPGEAELASKLISILPCADRVAFCSTGTEAVMLALRLARAKTGRSKIIRFQGHYHGWSDSIFTSFPSSDMKPGISRTDTGAVLPGTSGQSGISLQDIILLPWNDSSALEETLRERHEDIAAVITEPVMCNTGCIHPLPGYLEDMRRLTERYGVTLIFDEVITGFRLGLGGAHARFGIQPDLITMGKALAGGVPLGLVGGNAEWMDLISSGTVSHLGTLNGNPLATGAAIATIAVLEADNGEPLRAMERYAAALAEEIRTLLRRRGIPGLVNQIGPVFHMMFIDLAEVNRFEEFQARDSAAYARFAELMLHRGVLVRPNGLWYVSGAHSQQDFETTVEAIDASLGDLTAR